MNIEKDVFLYLRNVFKITSFYIVFYVWAILTEYTLNTLFAAQSPQRATIRSFSVTDAMLFRRLLKVYFGS